MRGARSALRRLGECGADIVLSGHLHRWHARPFTSEEGVLFVQAGTGLSTRVRGEPNDFNLLTIDGRSVLIERWTAGNGESAFRPASASQFQKEGPIWREPVDAYTTKASPSVAASAPPLVMKVLRPSIT